MIPYKLLVFAVNFLFFVIFLVLFFIGFILIKKRKKFIGITIIFSAILIDLFLSTQAVLLTSPLLSQTTKFTIEPSAKIYTIPPSLKPQAQFFNRDIEEVFSQEKREILLPNQNISNKIYALDGYASMANAGYINQFADASETITGLGKLDISKIDFFKHGVKYVISETKLPLTGLTTIQNKYPYIYKVDKARNRYFLTQKGRIATITETPAEMVFNIKAERNSDLVVLDTWYPGWKAEVDNKSVVINKFEQVYKSINIPQGNHNVHLYFYPDSFVLGFIITSVFFISIIALLPVLKNKKI